LFLGREKSEAYVRLRTEKKEKKKGERGEISVRPTKKYITRRPKEKGSLEGRKKDFSPSPSIAEKRKEVSEAMVGKKGKKGSPDAYFQGRSKRRRTREERTANARKKKKEGGYAMERVIGPRRGEIDILLLGEGGRVPMLRKNRS